MLTDLKSSISFILKHIFMYLTQAALVVLKTEDDICSSLVFFCDKLCLEKQIRIHNSFESVQNFQQY